MIPRTRAVETMSQRSHHPRPALRIVALAAALGGARPALAQADRVPLAWDAPPGCPTADKVLADVKASLAESGDGQAPFVAAVTVREPAGGLWHASLRVETRGGRTERQFEAESCEAIASAAALIVALSAESPGAAAPAPEQRDIPAVAAGPQSRVVSPGDWRPGQLSAMVNAIADGGTMPDSPARGFEIAVGMSWTIPFWRLRALAGSGFFPAQHTVALGTDGDVRLLTLSGRGCLTATPSVIELGGCLGAEVAVMNVANATGIQNNSQRTFAVNDGTQLWVSPLVAAVVAWNISPRISVFGKAEVVVPSIQRTFLAVVPNGTEPLLWEIYVVPTVATRAALGVEVRFF
jgi:hypothetical protein